MTLASKQLKIRPRMVTPPLGDDGSAIDVGAAALGNARIERGCGFSPRRLILVIFERALDDYSDRTPFSARETMRQIARLGAAHAKLRFRHGRLLLRKCGRGQIRHPDVGRRLSCANNAGCAARNGPLATATGFTRQHFALLWRACRAAAPSAPDRSKTPWPALWPTARGDTPPDWRWPRPFAGSQQ